MNYRGTKKGNYGNRPSRRPPASHVRKARKKTETEWRIKLNPPCITKTEKIQEEETPIPEEIEEKVKTSPKLTFRNQAGSVELERSNEKTTTKKLPKATDYV